MISNLGLKFINLVEKNKKNKAIILDNKHITFDSLDLDSNKICNWLLKKKLFNLRCCLYFFRKKFL